MDIRIRAAARTAGFFALCIVSPVLTIMLFRLNPEVFVWTFATGVIAFLIWIMYRAMLNQLKLEQEINESFERLNKVLQKY
jgi:hypothetical protein